MVKYYLLDLDDKIVIAQSETMQYLEDWAQDEMTNNYDIIGTDMGFSKAYGIGELIIFYTNLTNEVEGIDFDFSKSTRSEVANTVLLLLARPTSDIPTIDEGGLPMVKKRAIKKKAATKKAAAPARKKATTKAATSGKTRTSLASTQKVKRGEKPKSAASVAGSIWAYCSKQMTIDDLCEGLVMDGYTPPRREEPATVGYLKGYVSAMLRSGELAKV